MKGIWAFIVTYPHSLQKGPKTLKWEWVHTMDKYHALWKTMEQHYGKENIGSSYKHIVKVSPQQICIP